MIAFLVACLHGLLLIIVGGIAGWVLREVKYQREELAWHRKHVKAQEDAIAAAQNVQIMRDVLGGINVLDPKDK